jgi:hypothetical protein
VERISAKAKDVQSTASIQDDLTNEASDNDLTSYPEKVVTEITRLKDPRFGVISAHWLDSEYAALFRQLKLPDAKLERLKSLLAERLQAATGAMRLGTAEDLVIDDMPDEKAILDAGTTDIDEAISAELGDADYGAFKAYQASASARRFMIAPFAQHLSSSSEPLSDSQVDQLAAAASQAGFGANAIVMRPPGPAIPSSLDSAATSVLSPAQQRDYQEFRSFWAAKNQVSTLALASFIEKQTAIANGQTK